MLTFDDSCGVAQLLAQMTLDEKLRMVSGGPEPNATNQYEGRWRRWIRKSGRCTSRAESAVFRVGAEDSFSE